jgi:hypothetical protein
MLIQIILKGTGAYQEPLGYIEHVPKEIRGFWIVFLGSSRDPKR